MKPNGRCFGRRGRRERRGTASRCSAQGACWCAGPRRAWTQSPVERRSKGPENTSRRREKVSLRDQPTVQVIETHLNEDREDEEAGRDQIRVDLVLRQLEQRATGLQADTRLDVGPAKRREEEVASSSPDERRLCQAGRCRSPVRQTRVHAPLGKDRQQQVDHRRGSGGGCLSLCV